MKTPEVMVNARARLTLIFLALAIGAASLLMSVRKVDEINGDFCAWVHVHDMASHQMPQVGPRLKSENADVALEQKLGC